MCTVGPWRGIDSRDNAHEGVPGAAGADKELDETQLCSSKYEIRSHGEILLIFFTLLPVKFIAA